MRGRDFLSIADLDREELIAILDRAAEIKAGRWAERPLAGKQVAMIFQKPSMRTRVSFEVGIQRLGGATVTLSEGDVQIGVREPVADAARVLDRYVDLVVARLRRHADLVELAQSASVPVVNALTEQEHPCQVLADLMTVNEVLGHLAGARVTYLGDGNNVCTSWIYAAALCGVDLRVVSPPGYEPPISVLQRGAELRRHGTPFTLTQDPAQVLSDTDVVYTDVWASMGQETEQQRRRTDFARLQVNDALMALAPPSAHVMHCLPAHRGEEITDSVIDGPQSIVFDQAENRLWVQMALLAQLYGRTAERVA